MTETYGDEDADLSLVQDRNVAVLGYDDQARAQALCLRDSGVDVRVGLDPGALSWDDAVADGLRVVTPYEACEEADLLVLLRVEAGDPIVNQVALPNLVPGDAVVLGGSAGLDVPVPAGVDVVRIAPWVDGDALRDEYTQGRGAPLFAAVVLDASGQAWSLALAYARAIGGTRAGVIRTTDDELAGARLFANGTLLRDGVLPLVRAGFDTLVASGCQPAVAYLQCVHGLKVFADALDGGALDGELVAARRPADGGPVADVLPAAAAMVRSLMGTERGGPIALH